MPSEKQNTQNRLEELERRIKEDEKHKKFVKALKTNPATFESYKAIHNAINDKDFNWLMHDSNGNNYLHIACQYAPLEVLAKLIDKMKQIDYVYKSVRYNKSVKYTLYEAFLLLDRNNKNRSPLTLAITSNRKDKQETTKIIKLILDNVKDSKKITGEKISAYDVLPKFIKRGMSLQRWIYEHNKVEVLKGIFNANTITNKEKQDFVYNVAEKAHETFFFKYEDWSLDDGAHTEIETGVTRFESDIRENPAYREMRNLISHIPENRPINTTDNNTQNKNPTVKDLADLLAQNKTQQFLDGLCEYLSKPNALMEKLAPNQDTLLHRAAKHKESRQLVSAILNTFGLNDKEQGVREAKKTFCNMKDENGKTALDICNNKDAKKLLSQYTEPAISKQFNFRTGIGYFKQKLSAGTNNNPVRKKEQEEERKEQEKSRTSTPQLY